MLKDKKCNKYIINQQNSELAFYKLMQHLHKYISFKKV